MLETRLSYNLDCWHPCKGSFTLLLLSALQEWFLCWKRPETFRGSDKNTFLQSACILSFWEISLLLLNFDCQVTFKDHFRCPKRQHCSQGILGSSCARQQVTFQYYFIVSGFWNFLGVDSSNHITLHLLQKNWECWASPCPGEIVKGALERALFTKANKNLGRRLCWKQSYAWEIWLCVFSDHKRSGHQFSIAS